MISMKKAFILYSQPGGGKGTQAELLSRKFDVIHFDTGHYLEGVLHAPGAGEDPKLAAEQVLWDTGKLNTPEWVLSIVSERVTQLAQSGFGVVFSGSPRTLYEAFGDATHPGLVQVLEKLYGRENVVVIHLKVPDSASYERNGSRLICKECGLPVLGMVKVPHCAFCGGEFYRRKLDTLETIKVRLDEYHNRTSPIFDALNEKKYSIVEIDGTKLPFEVHEEIIQKLKLK